MKALVLAAFFLVVLAPAAIAQPKSLDDSSTVFAFTEADSEGDAEEAPPTTMVSEGGITPAELAPAADETVAEDQWTAKYLAPTVAILGALGVVAAFALYGIRLRARFRVVE